MVSFMLKITLTGPLLFLDNASEALRYGFHQTQQCNNFEKAFLCIRKCLDFRYDVAFSDKDCYCTCYIKKEKGKYKYLGAVTQWKLGAPTTKMPAWALPDNSLFVNHQEDEAIGAELQGDNLHGDKPDGDNDDNTENHDNQHNSTIGNSDVQHNVNVTTAVTVDNSTNADNIKTDLTNTASDSAVNGFADTTVASVNQ
ncbi:uncharacterized protein LOC116412797 [Galleria mellonella]|uniref:Uncharacterized protein LOC116412797 n=1 Tax=Galleria mellonella TaxID=7137 RepID=A0ABM3MW15_GALME|nr:uncharacterized protein LOC116412797 [Galleria mellonella]